MPSRAKCGLALLLALVLVAPLASGLRLPAAPPVAGAHPAPALVVPEPASWAQDPRVALSPVKAAPLPLAPPASEPSALPDLGLFPAPQDDCGTGEDANSAVVALPADCTGNVTEAYDWDFYVLPTSDWGTLVTDFSFSAANASTTLKVCVTHSWNPSSDRCALASPGEPIHVATAQGPGNYTLVIHADSWGGQEATYHFTASFRAWTLGPDCGAGDAGDDAANATPLSAPVACAGTLNPRDDPVDWYSVQVDAGRAVAVSLAPNPDADFDLCVYADPAGWPLDCSLLPMGRVDRVLLQPAQSGTFFVRVVQWDGAEGYALDLSDAAPQDDCGSGGDAGSAYRFAHAELPLACEGTLDPAAGDHVDIVSFPLGQAGLRTHLSTSAPEGAFFLCVYRPFENHPVACEDTDASGQVDVPYMTARAGNWSVGVWAESPDAGAYRLDVAGFDPTPQDDCGTGKDAGDAWWSTLRADAPFACGGTLRGSEGDALDRYVAFVPASSVTLTFGSASTALELCISTPSVSRCYASNGGTAQVELQAIRAGNWTLSVSHADHEDASYALGIALGPAYDDCGTGGDAASSWAWNGNPQGSPLATPASCHGRLYVDSGDRSDHYALHVAHDDGAFVLTLRSTGPIQVCVQPAKGGLEYCRLYFLSADEQTQEWDDEGLPAGDYVVMLDADGPAPVVDYDLTANVL